MSRRGGETARDGRDAAGDVAIIGMACLFPGAPDLESYWRNIVSKTDAIVDPPADTWDVDVHFDPDSRENDRVYCKKGGYLGELATFDPLEHGVPPLAVKGGEPEQWLALRVAREAIADAGYADGVPDPERTAVILGKGDYVNRGNLSLLQHHGFVDQTLDIIRSLIPELGDDDLIRIRRDLKRDLPPFNADTVPALVPNIAAGRIANRLGLMGPSYTVDAACASSLIAVDIAVKDLRDRHCDLAIVGGMHVALPMLIRQVFCQLGALSHAQRIRPLDENADGTILGEGVGMAILKRLEEAERDGNRIYAVVKGVGTASDGRGASVMAPRLEGELLALRRAYESTGIAPETVGLIEAHGTGTPVGDATEVEALRRTFGLRSGRFPRCAIGSVKSMIGHLMPAAGIAGLIKTALALHHKVLPPTLGVETPSAGLLAEDSPIYVNTEARPWIHGAAMAPRRAGVNAFGFGGINAHVVLEEHRGDEERSADHGAADWESELFLVSASDPVSFGETLRGLLRRLERDPGVRLVDLAYTLNVATPRGSRTLAIVASSVADLSAKLTRVLDKLAAGTLRRVNDTRNGLYYFEEPLGDAGQVAFLFPGEGSQYAGMLADLCLRFPEVRQRFEIPERNFVRTGSDVLPSDCFFPPPLAPADDKRFAESWLWQMQGAVTAVLTADYAVFTLLDRLGIRPAALLGHSTGEFSAMVASGMIDLSEAGRADAFAAELNQLFQRLKDAESRIPRASLVAIGGDSASIRAILGEAGSDLSIAMDNCPHQTVLAGEPALVDRAVKALQARGMICERLAFDRPYHTRQFAPFAEPMAGFFERWISRPPSVPIYCCASKTVFPESLAEARELAVEQWMRPVAFRETIEAMYADGVRLFVEAGARGNLSAFVDDILRGRPHLAVPADLESRPGTTQLVHLLGALAAHGVPIDLGRLYSARSPRRIDLAGPDDALAAAGATPPRRLPLETGWPVLALSAETLAALSGRGSTRGGRAPSPAAAADRHQTPAAAPCAARDTPGVEVGEPRSAVGAVPPVVSAHMRAMEQFLEVNEAVMRSYLARSARGATRPPPAGSASARPGPQAATAAPAAPTAAETSVRDRAPADALPLAGTVLSITPGEQVVVRRELDPESDLFLRQHTFGRRVATTNPQLIGLPVMPLTMSMELMAEAASRLAPGLPLAGMRDVRGFRWLSPESGPLALRIAATARPDAPRREILVRVFEDGAGEDAPASFEIPLIEATMIFGSRDDAPRAAESFPLARRRDSKWTPERLYEDVMFHEPGMQGVASLDAVGDDGAEATLVVLPRDGLFRDTPAPSFLTDPVLLDQVGQIVGFWAIDSWVDDVFFPFHVESLDLYDGPPPVGERMTCRARVSRQGDDQVRADLDVVRGDGRLWMRCLGWQDRRFTMPKRIVNFFLEPRTTVLSERRVAPNDAPLPRGVSSFSLRRDSFPSDFFTSGGGIWLRSIAYAALGPAERERWRRELMRRPLPDRVGWLLERIVAKDAIRDHLARHHRLTLCPADIEIAVDSQGRQVPAGRWAAAIPEIPLLSVAANGEAAVAVVGSSGRSLGLGVDIARGDAENLPLDATPAERELLDAAAAGGTDAWAVRLQCAKRAAARAWAGASRAGPPPFAAHGIDPARGVVSLVPSGGADRGLGPRAEVIVHTTRDGDHVIAVCLCRPKTEEQA